MAGISITTDATQVNLLYLSLANLTGQYNWIAARAMTTGVKTAKSRIEQKIYPLIKGGPSRWTKRGLIMQYAKPTDLRAQVGFQYGDGEFNATFESRKSGGVPAGRYMDVNAVGGLRRPKSIEKQLRKTRVLAHGQFLVPNKNLTEIDKHGNLPAKLYTQIGSRIGGLSTPGSTQNAPAKRGAGSRGRTAAKRRRADYFIMHSRTGYERERIKKQMNDPMARQELTRMLLSQPRKNIFIARRVGYKMRGFEPVLWIVDDAKYRARFPIQTVALAGFESVYATAFEQGVTNALLRRR